MAENSEGSTASWSSRFTSWNCAIDPLCIHSQRPWRNGWQFVHCTGVPVAALMWAKTTPERTWPASSRRFLSFQAGSTLLNSAGASPSPYQPTPNPSPFVVSTPSFEWRLWSISECTGV